MAEKSSIAPQGTTHRYEHGGLTSWYRETAENLFVWRDGSWHGSAFKSAKDLMESCPLGIVTALGFEQSEPVEDDLTWLARETNGDWPEGDAGIARSGGVVISAEHYEQVEDGCHWFTKSEYLERKAGLQNKPSWAEAPEWATFLSQDEDGVWYWHGKQPKPKGETVTGEKYWVSCGESMPNGRGDLLGDWRDTLERRPADLSEAAVTERLGEATQNVLAAVPGLIDEKYRFDRNNWHERGELPPVGLECEFDAGPFGWFGCEIIAHYKGDAVFAHKDSIDRGKAEELRPIRTERDELIDILCSTGWYDKAGTWAYEMADAILAAGFKRGDV